MHPMDHYKEPYGPDNDFFRAWVKDFDGRDCRIGLSFVETEEFEKLSMDWLADKSAPNWRTITREQVEVEAERFEELRMQHEMARLARLSDPEDRKLRVAELLSRHPR